VAAAAAAAARLAEAGDDDLPVPLDRDRGGALVAAPNAEASRHPAAPAEARVESAVSVVAGEREVAAAARLAAGGDDLPVRLDRDRVGGVVAAAAAGVSRHLAAPAAARGERA